MRSDAVGTAIGNIIGRLIVLAWNVGIPVAVVQSWDAHHSTLAAMWSGMCGWFYVWFTGPVETGMTAIGVL